MLNRPAEARGRLTRRIVLASESEFVRFVVESLRAVGPVNARRMFGGCGLFLDGVMFALVVDDRLYFKVDDGNRPAYEARSLEPFSYTRRGRRIEMSYREAPSEGFDDPDVLCAFAREALAAALRAGRPERR